MLETTEALKRLLVALLVGLLIGLDRERAEHRKHRPLFAGIRTFPLIALLGAALSVLRAEIGPWPLVTGLVAVSAISIVSYRSGAEQGEVGATTEIAAIATYALGIVAGVGQLVLAGATGVAMAVLLAAKPPLERLSRAISEPELVAVLELAVISAIVLPLLPDRGFGPWDALNPFRIWMVVVLVSVVSFAGFVAVRWRGNEAGLLWSAALGALVSSTATTVAMAQRSRQAPEASRALAAAAILASMVMCVRVLVLIAVVAPALVPRLSLAVAAMVVVGGTFALVLARRGASSGPKEAAVRKLGNPFSLGAALGFGALFAAATLLVRACREWLGAAGTTIAAALSGLVDVDAVSIALARAARADADTDALVGILVACASNNVFKGGVAVVSGAGRFRRDVALALAAMAAVAGAAAFLTLRLA